MESKQPYELRRTLSLPSGRVLHSNLRRFNGLDIKYIGSCCDNRKKIDNRDFVLVRQPGKYYYASNGSKLEWRLFYRSTGTSDKHSIRNGVWFPAYGWTLTSGGLLINKGLLYEYDKTGNRIQYYNGFGIPLIGLLKVLYDSVHGYTKKILREILTRWNNEDSFIISALLGGGLWNEKNGELSNYFNSFRNTLINTPKYDKTRIYHTPTTQQFITHYEINDIMGINNEYGVDYSEAAKLSRLLYLIVNHSKYNSTIEAQLSKPRYNTHIGDSDGDYFAPITETPFIYKNNDDHKLSHKLKSHNLKLPFIQDVEKLSEYPDIFNDMVRDAEEILDKLNTQDGGNKNQLYNFIVNPLTNRRVNINTQLGKRIIKNYVNKDN